MKKRLWLSLLTVAMMFVAQAGFAQTVFTPPYFQNFGAYELANGWDEFKATLGPTVTPTGTTSAWTDDYWQNNAGSTFNNCARINIYGASTVTGDWATSPLIYLGDGSVKYELVFKLGLTEYAETIPATLGSDDVFAVVISTDNGRTWSNANTLRQWNSTTPISNTGDSIIIDLSAYSDTVKFGFYGSSTVSNADVDLFVDNVEVRAKTTGGGGGGSVVTVPEVEPNNTPALANIVAGGTVNGAVGTVGDADWFSFNVAAGTTFRLITGLPGGSSLDPMVQLYDVTGTMLLAQNDDRSVGDLQSQIEYTSMIGGTYLVRLTAATKAPADQNTGAYRLYVQNTVYFQPVNITVGSGSDVSRQIPINTDHLFSYTQSIYLASEINNGVGGYIDQITYHHNSTPGYVDEIAIYMGSTTQETFGAWIPLNQLDLVYAGSLVIPQGGGWVRINLTTPFQLAPGMNLVIAIDENTPYCTAAGDGYYGTTLTANRTIYLHQDCCTNIDPNTPAAGTPSPFRPNIRLTQRPFLDLCTEPINLKTIDWQDPYCPDYYSSIIMWGDRIDLHWDVNPIIYDDGIAETWFDVGADMCGGKSNMLAVRFEMIGTGVIPEVNVAIHDSVPGQVKLVYGTTGNPASDLPNMADSLTRWIDVRVSPQNANNPNDPRFAWSAGVTHGMLSSGFPANRINPAGYPIYEDGQSIWAVFRWNTKTQDIPRVGADARDFSDPVFYYDAPDAFSRSFWFHNCEWQELEYNLMMRLDTAPRNLAGFRVYREECLTPATTNASATYSAAPFNVPANLIGDIKGSNFIDKDRLADALIGLTNPEDAFLPCDCLPYRYCVTAYYDNAQLCHSGEIAYGYPQTINYGRVDFDSPISLNLVQCTGNGQPAGCNPPYAHNVDYRNFDWRWCAITDSMYNDLWLDPFIDEFDWADDIEDLYRDCTTTLKPYVAGRLNCPEVGVPQVPYPSPIPNGQIYIPLLPDTLHLFGLTDQGTIANMDPALTNPAVPGPKTLLPTLFKSRRPPYVWNDPILGTNLGRFTLTFNVGAGAPPHPVGAQLVDRLNFATSYDDNNAAPDNGTCDTLRTVKVNIVAPDTVRDLSMIICDRPASAVCNVVTNGFDGRDTTRFQLHVNNPGDAPMCFIPSLSGPAQNVIGIVRPAAATTVPAKGRDSVTVAFYDPLANADYQAVHDFWNGDGVGPLPSNNPINQNTTLRWFDRMEEPYRIQRTLTVATNGCFVDNATVTAHRRAAVEMYLTGVGFDLRAGSRRADNANDGACIPSIPQVDGQFPCPNLPFALDINIDNSYCYNVAQFSVELQDENMVWGDRNNDGVFDRNDLTVSITPAGRLAGIAQIASWNAFSLNGRNYLLIEVTGQANSQGSVFNLMPGDGPAIRVEGVTSASAANDSRNPYNFTNIFGGNHFSSSDLNVPGTAQLLSLHYINGCFTIGPNPVQLVFVNPVSYPLTCCNRAGWWFGSHDNRVNFQVRTLSCFNSTAPITTIQFSLRQLIGLVNVTQYYQVSQGRLRDASGNDISATVDANGLVTFTGEWRANTTYSGWLNVDVAWDYPYRTDGTSGFTESLYGGGPAGQTAVFSFANVFSKDAANITHRVTAIDTIGVMMTDTKGDLDNCTLDLPTGLTDEIDVRDVVELLNGLSGGFTSDDCKREAADWNDNGAININDVYSMITFIVRRHNPALPSFLRPFPTALPATQVPAQLTLAIEGDQLKVMLGNDQALAAVTMELELSNVELDQVQKASDRLEKMGVFTEVNGNRVSYHIISLVADVFGAGNDAILTIPFKAENSGEARIVNVAALDANGQDVAVQFSSDAQGVQNVPKVFAADQNFPNPFNPSTTIKYQIPQAGRVTVEVYNASGQLVRTLVNDQKQVGYHQAVWNGKNNIGSDVSSGVYFYQVKYGQETVTKKMMLLK